MPRGQVRQASASEKLAFTLASRYLPAAHFTHANSPALGWNSPKAHARQALFSGVAADSAASRNLPIAHCTQDKAFCWSWNWPVAQSAHVRSDEFVHAEVWKRPAAQVDMSRHTRSAVALGALYVYCPFGQYNNCVAHSRSEKTVGGLDSYSLSLHVVSGAQGRASSTFDQEPPASRGKLPLKRFTHGPHSRLVIAEPFFTLPYPGGHVFISMHVVCPDVFWNWPASQTVHATDSGEYDGAETSRYFPAAQAVHDNRFDAFWKRPISHAAHSRFVVALGAMV